MKQSKSVIRFHLQYPFKLAERRKLKERIKLLFDREGKTLNALDYIFCSDEYLLNINQSFLKHDTLTDIITFDMSENFSSISGEIYISVERVKENANHFDVPFHVEMNRVLFHGALHLCGYRDKSIVEQKQMRAKEDDYLSLRG